MKCKLILVVELLVLFICVGLGDGQDSKPLPPITMTSDSLENGAFRNLPAVTEVVLIHNEKTLDVGILSESSLVNLTLILTACKSLPDEPLNISSLSNLTIVGQKVTRMPSSFLSGVNNVEILHLDLPELQLLSLPSENQLKNLKTLKIRNVKKIEPFPKLPAMSQLELHGICERREIKLFQNIDSLQTMVITGCGLSELPRAWVSDLSSLTELNLSNNNLTSHGIPSLAALESLQDLNLGHNQIQDPMPQLPASLKMLILRENSIQNLTNTFFSGLNKLKWLDLSSNSIHTIENATFLPLPQIIKIDLKQNIYYLPVSLQKKLCHKLKLAAFMLENNPIRCECILECLRNSNAKSNCNKLDVQICQGSAGQSTTPSYKEPESTRILLNTVDLKDHTTEGQDPSLPATTLNKDAVMKRQRRGLTNQTQPSLSRAGDNEEPTTGQTLTTLGQNSTHSSGNLDSVVEDNQQMSGNISTPTSLAPNTNDDEKTQVGLTGDQTAINLTHDEPENLSSINALEYTQTHSDTHDIPNVTTASAEATQKASISSASDGQSTLELTTQPSALPTATTRSPTSKDKPAVGPTSLHQNQAQQRRGLTNQTQPSLSRAGDNEEPTTGQTLTTLGQNSTHSSGNLDSVVEDNQQMSGNISTPTSLAPNTNDDEKTQVGLTGDQTAINLTHDEPENLSSINALEYTQTHSDTHDIHNVTTASAEATQKASISSASDGQSTLELTTQPSALPTATRSPTSKDKPAVGPTSLHQNQAPVGTSEILSSDKKVLTTSPSPHSTMQILVTHVQQNSSFVSSLNDTPTVTPTSLPTSDSSKMTGTTPLKTSMGVDNVNPTETDAVVVNTKGTQTTNAIDDVQDVEDAPQELPDTRDPIDQSEDTEKDDLDLDKQVSGTKMDQKSPNKGQKGTFSVSLVVTVIVVGVMLVVISAIIFMFVRQRYQGSYDTQESNLSENNGAVPLVETGGV